MLWRLPCSTPAARRGRMHEAEAWRKEAAPAPVWALQWRNPSPVLDYRHVCYVVLGQNRIAVHAPALRASRVLLPYQESCESCLRRRRRSSAQGLPSRSQSHPQHCCLPGTGRCAAATAAPQTPRRKHSSGPAPLLSPALLASREEVAGLRTHLWAARPQQQASRAPRPPAAYLCLRHRCGRTPRRLLED